MNFRNQNYPFELATQRLVCLAQSACAVNFSPDARGIIRCFHTAEARAKIVHMITVEPVSEGLWLVTVSSRKTTRHRVGLSAKDLHRFGGGTATPEELLNASFRFLLDREPNTAILSEFELSLISRYFPEYEREISRYLAG